MYVAKSGIKTNSRRRWSRHDRIFVGHGARDILAGFHVERIVSTGGLPGHHVYVTDDTIVFDDQGYSSRERLLRHHDRVWSNRCGGWYCAVERVDFCLLPTAELYARNMLGPDQYLHDPVPRARNFVERRDHAAAGHKGCLDFVMKS